jgi:competence protein ComEC
VADAALVPALSLLLGIALGVRAGVPVPLGVVLIAAALTVGVSAYGAGRARLVVAAVSAGWAAAGMVLGARAEAAARDPPLRRLLAASSEAPVALAGILRQDAAIVPNGVSLSLRVREWTAGRGAVPVDDGVMVTVGGTPDPRVVAEWTAGRRIRAPAWLRVPATYRNPGVPDHALALARRGTALVGSIKSASLLQVEGKGSPVDEAAAAVRRRVRVAVADTVGVRSPRAGGVLVAILVGDRAGLDPADERRLQEAGTYHVIAISGGNIAILAGCLLVACRLACLPYRGGLAVTAGLLAMYAAVAGGGSSVARATLTAIVYLAARAIDQRSRPAGTLAVSGTLILCASPLALLDPGFLLTFGATIAIVTVVPRVVASVGGPAAVRAVVAMVAASLASEVALLPIGASFFNRVTFAGLALNFLAIPLMTVAQVGGMAVVGLHLAAPAWARAVAWVPQLAADWLIASSTLVSWMPWVTWRVPAPPPWSVAIYYTCLVAWIWWPASVARLAVRVPRARAAVAVVGSAAAAWMLIAPPWSSGSGLRRLVVAAIDVGQGDATLMRLPGGRALLVDAGGLGGGARFDVGERVVAPAAWALGVRRLEAFVATHGDVDHVGGAAAVAAMLRPREVWEAVPVADDPELGALVLASREGRIAWRTVQAGDAWRDGPVTVRVVHPPPAEWARHRVRNDDSIVLDVRYGHVSIVLAADAGAPVEAAIAARIDPAGLRVLKVGHHGSAGSTSDAFIAALRPDVAIVSCGRTNRFGHPAPAVTRRLFASGATLFRTDEHGAIVLDTDGREITVRTFAGEEVRFRAGTRGPVRKDVEPKFRAAVGASSGLADAIAVWLRRARSHERPRKGHQRITQRSG